MLEWLIILNVVVPLVAAVLCLFIKNHSVRAAIVIITAVDLIVTSVMLLFNGPTTSDAQTFLGVKIGEIVLTAEFVLLLFIFYIAFKLRNLLVGILTFIQFIGAIYFDFFLAHGVEVSQSFYIDELSIIMNLLISIVGSLICVFAIPYMKEHEHHLHLEKTRQPRFFAILMLFLGAMNALVLVNNLAWLYLFWEVTTLCSFLLIGHDGTEIAIKNATRAILLNMLGGVGFILGIITIYIYEGTISIQQIIANGPVAPLVLLPLALLCFAGFTKSAQVPFQSWLLGAMVAPTPVSALLHSSTMVKAGVYLIVRLAPAYMGTTLSTFVAIFGAFTFLATSALAISQSNGKRILAYSTIANLGLIITCAGINTPLAISAAILIIIFHGVSKGLLFLCVGTIEHGIGSRDLEDMHGLINKMPVTATIAVIGMITMLLPPFGMFLGKWGTMEAAPHMPLVMFLLVLGSAVTVVFWLRWTGILLRSSYDPAVKLQKEEQAFLTTLTLVILAAGALLLSFFVAYIMQFLLNSNIFAYYREGIFTSVARGFQDSILTPVGTFPILAIFCTLIAAIIVARISAGRARTARVVPAYLCGESGEDCASLSFRGAQDEWSESRAGLYYMDTYFGENRLTKPSNVLAILIMVAMFGVILL